MALGTRRYFTEDEIAAITGAEPIQINDDAVRAFLGQRAGIFAPQGTIADLILGARADLRRSTELLEKAIGERIEAVLRERAARSLYEDEKVAAAARYHAEGLAGGNQAARDADLAAKLLTDPTLGDIAQDLAEAMRRRIEAEGYERQCDIRHKALREEVRALGALAGN